MINMALYKREMKGSIKLLVILGAIITMYVSIIINDENAGQFCAGHAGADGRRGHECRCRNASGFHGILSLWIHTADFSHVILCAPRKCPGCQICG